VGSARFPKSFPRPSSPTGRSRLKRAISIAGWLWLFLGLSVVPPLIAGVLGPLDSVELIVAASVWAGVWLLLMQIEIRLRPLSEDGHDPARGPTP